MNEWMKPKKSCLYVGGNGVVDDAKESSFFLEKVQLLKKWGFKIQNTHEAFDEARGTAIIW